MGGLSLVHWAIVLLVVVLLFGRVRASEIMEDFGKGIRSFRRGLNEDDIAGGDAQAAELLKQLETQTNPPEEKV